jgi:hypothetical protein
LASYEFSSALKPLANRLLNSSFSLVESGFELSEYNCRQVNTIEICSGLLKCSVTILRCYINNMYTSSTLDSSVDMARFLSVLYISTSDCGIVYGCPYSIITFDRNFSG